MNQKSLYPLTSMIKEIYKDKIEDLYYFHTEYHRGKFYKFKTQKEHTEWKQNINFEEKFLDSLDG